jgi:proteic killer suppression protein
MIRNVSHKGLDRFLREGDTSGINPQLADKILEAVAEVAFVNRVCFFDPKFKAHNLDFFRKNQTQARWSIKLSGSWRLTFRKDSNGDTLDLDLVQYH